MNLDQKKTFVADIKQRFEKAPLVILTDFIGSTVDEMNQLRRACEPEGIHLQVVKNTLCRRALEGTEHEGSQKASQIHPHLPIVQGGPSRRAPAGLKAPRVPKR